MTTSLFSVIFIAFLLAHIGLKTWLARRHITHIKAHRATVPSEFAAKISLAAHQKAADYSVAKSTFGLYQSLFGVVLILGFTFWGGLQVLFDATSIFSSPLANALLLLVAFSMINGVLDFPFDWYRQFVIEARFGFNKMTVKLFLQDMVKSLALSLVIGLPLIGVLLWLIESSGKWWWVYAWGVLCAFNVLILVLYPTVIAPLFNRFDALEDQSLRSRIDALLARCGFRAAGLFVMDGSRRSAHGNAYFTGIGKNKRIVFFDTLLKQLSPPEIEAVLAHELGHFTHHHVIKRIGMSFVFTFVLLGVLAYLIGQPWFYAGLGVDSAALSLLLGAPPYGVALILFMLVTPVFGFVLQPLMAASSRRHEFEADSFAAQNADANELVSALVKMYEDNASTLTPDPLHSRFYDSHPPASVRIAHLKNAVPS